MLAVAFPTPAAAGPAEDEYVLELPGAGGKGKLGSGPPQGNPGELPPAVAGALRNNVEDRFLTQIATADELNAPAVRASASPGGADRPAGPDRGGAGAPLDTGADAPLEAAAVAAVAEAGTPSFTRALADGAGSPGIAVLIAVGLGTLALAAASRRLRRS